MYRRVNPATNKPNPESVTIKDIGIDMGIKPAFPAIV